MKAKFWTRIAIVMGCVLIARAPGESSTHDFYQGKTIRLVVGQAAGGGYDLSARTIARHIG